MSETWLRDYIRLLFDPLASLHFMKKFLRGNKRRLDGNEPRVVYACRFFGDEKRKGWEWRRFDRLHIGVGRHFD